MTAATTAGAVRAARTFSTRRITLAGEKKCMPMTMCGRLGAAAAIWSMSRAEVLVHRSVEAGQIASSCAKICRFTSRLSKTASTTISHLARGGLEA